MHHTFLRFSRPLFLLILCLPLTSYAPVSEKEEKALGNPILFVTLQPGFDFMYQLNTFANHTSSWGAAPRGSDLWILYPDGSMRNLTREAGFGEVDENIQAEKAIAVRQPTVHWDGNKAVFSMIVGGPKKKFDVSYAKNHWQIYEVTGLAKGETAVITKVANQPDYNNVSPVYSTDDQILFTSDKPWFNMNHTYPLRDEYESTETVSGIFKLNPISGSLKMIEAAPSGAFDLFVDSFGRLLFTKWDHLKRDQQADLERYGDTSYGSVDIADESAGAGIKVYPQTQNGKPIADSRGVLYDLFPEARHEKDPTRDPNEPLHDFNQFMIWEINEDGSNEQVINHAGRDEFGGTFMFGSKIDDPNLDYAFTNFSANKIRNTFGSDAGLFQVKEHPNKPGTYFATYAHEFGRNASGRTIEFSLPPGTNPETMNMIDWTNPKLDDDPYGDKPATSDMTGHYRNPLMLENETMLVTHDPEYRLGNKKATVYNFRIKPLIKRFPDKASSTEHITGDPLTGAGIKRKLQYWDDGDFVTYEGLMNEVDMVEVRPRTRSVARKSVIEPVEKSVLDEEGVDEEELRKWLVDNNMSLIVSRNLTLRDRADVHQPYNLRVPGGVSSTPTSGKVYDISHFQIFQADLTRAYKEYKAETLQPGRRVFAKPLHNSEQHPNVTKSNVANPAGPLGSVKIGLDGSMAAFVPSGRPLTWQTTNDSGKGIVRERNWLTFAPGEIRTCTNCHGLNSKTHAGLNAPENKPEALRELMKLWKAGGNGEDVITGINETVNAGFSLSQNYPNPFMGNTQIEYTLPKSAWVVIRIYDALGNEVSTLVNEEQEKGVKRINWNGTSLAGLPLSKGMYIYTIHAGQFTSSKKMLLIK